MNFFIFVLKQEKCSLCQEEKIFIEQIKENLICIIEKNF